VENELPTRYIAHGDDSFAFSRNRLDLEDVVYVLPSVVRSSRKQLVIPLTIVRYGLLGEDMDVRVGLRRKIRVVSLLRGGSWFHYTQ